MLQNNCIQHPSKRRFIVINDWQLQACDGNVTAAALLSYFERWHNWKLDEQDKFASHKKYLESHSCQVDQPEPSLLQFHPEQELAEGIMHIGSRDRIRAAIALLIEKDFISQHKNPNPRYKFDRTRYFMFHPMQVNAWIKAMETPSSDSQSSSSENRRRSSENRKTITEKTPEKTPEKTLNTQERVEKLLKAEIIQDKPVEVKQVIKVPPKPLEPKQLVAVPPKPEVEEKPPELKQPVAVPPKPEVIPDAPKKPIETPLARKNVLSSQEPSTPAATPQKIEDTENIPRNPINGRYIFPWETGRGPNNQFDPAFREWLYEYHLQKCSIFTKEGVEANIALINGYMRKAHVEMVRRFQMCEFWNVYVEILEKKGQPPAASEPVLDSFISRIQGELRQVILNGNYSQAQIAEIAKIWEIQGRSDNMTLLILEEYTFQSP